MKHKFEGWGKVADDLRACAEKYEAHAKQFGESNCRINLGQRASLRAIAKRIPDNGLVIADEVGMGKTRIAVELIRCVVQAGGRAAVLVPSALDVQWLEELKEGGVEVAPILRSLAGFLNGSTTNVSNASRSHFTDQVSLISHTFTNWKIGGSTKSKWWTLLPLVLARWRKQTSESKRSPRGYFTHEAKLNFKVDTPDDVHKSADRIVSTRSAIGKQRLKKLSNNSEVNDWGRNSPLLAPSNYTKDTPWRHALEQVVGIGLGEFDLLIIDEAHKNRGVESGLSNLLKKVIMSSPQARRVSMTATPVELNVSQWEQTLDRIGVDEDASRSIEEVTQCYAESVKRIRQSPNDADARVRYQVKSQAFQKALSPYLLRRDKREDAAVQLFAKHTGRSIHAYRQESEITVETASLSLLWRQAVCAAEALSAVSRQAENSQAKRLRLTIANGHGITGLIDKATRVIARPEEEAEDEEDRDLIEESMNAVDTKRAARVAWWIGAMSQAVRKDGAALFHHPGVLAAVDAIEIATKKGEKVLVFGRFTQPMRVLVALLNAREMLRCLQNDRPWPQSRIVEATADDAHVSDRLAMEAGHEQIQCALGLDEIDRRLQSQYDKLEYQREKLRNNLVANIESGFASDAAIASSKKSMLFETFKRRAQLVESADDRNVLALVSKAIQEFLGEQSEVSEADYAAAFSQLIDSLGDRGESDQDDDDELDEQEAGKLWERLETRLHEEFSRPQGRFARLMYGGTKPESRRLMQLAFNRPASYLKVLVAQSTVGREGLNLHKACRTVVLLHPEWNPGVVEQQIGRVDRVGSHWETQLNSAVKTGCHVDELPRIEVRPVIFRDTYDEHNWKVLRERWEELRSQLHGIVSPPNGASVDLEQRQLFDEIAKSAPNFSPLREQ